MFDKIIYKREKRLQSFFIDATGNICFEMDLAGVWLNSGNSFLEITSVTLSFPNCLDARGKI